MSEKNIEVYNSMPEGYKPKKRYDISDRLYSIIFAAMSLTAFTAIIASSYFNKSSQKKKRNIVLMGHEIDVNNDGLTDIVFKQGYKYKVLLQQKDGSYVPSTQKYDNLDKKIKEAQK